MRRRKIYLYSMIWALAARRDVAISMMIEATQSVAFPIFSACG
jgi:hypothetical protein